MLVSRETLFLSIIIIFIRYVASEFEENSTYDYELMLRKNLLRNYNIHVLPKQSTNEPIRVDIRLSLANIRELNERTERLTIETYMQLAWNDSRLTWNSEDYGGIKRVRFPDNQIWQPDIKLFNSARASDIDPFGNVYTLVQEQGNVRWIPPATFHSICNVDLRMYPYDIQTCRLKFVSWTLDGHHVDVSLFENTTKIELAEGYNENNEWEVIDSKATKEIRYYGMEPYPEVIYELQLRRRAPYYKLTTLYPIMANVILCLATFWLPPTASERIVLGTINLLINVIILVHLSWKLPPTGRSVPMILWFSGNSVLIIAASIIVSMISISLGRSHHHRGAPNWMKVVFNSWLGRLLCVYSHRNVNKHGEPTVEFDLDDFRMSSYESCRDHSYYFSRDWKQCLKVLDRICFLVFMVIFAFALGSSFDR